MKNLAISVVALGIISMLVMNSFTLAADEKQTWEYGGIVYRLPIDRSKVVVPQETPTKHTVVKGDSLWFIARDNLKNPLLWPLIWDLNRDLVKNPHRIYPGQILNLPGVTAVPVGAEKTAEAVGAESTTEPGGPLNTVPITSRTMIEASGGISETKVKGPRIIASELNIFDISLHDVCYVDAGSDQGLKAGDTWSVVRTERPIYHPVTDKRIGYLNRNIGRAQILCVQPKSATILITAAYTDINIGDFLQTAQEIPVPVMSREMAAMDPNAERCNPPSGQHPGYIIDSLNSNQHMANAAVLGKNEIVYIDLGTKEGIVAGDTFRIFTRLDNPLTPEIPTGELIVLHTQERFSTCYITKSNLPIFVGQSIAMK